MGTNKAKGTAWESAICKYLNDALGETQPHRGSYIKRQAQTGAKDTGDIWAWPAVLEAKNVASIDLPAFIRQANIEATNAGFPFGVAVVKKRNAGARDAYAVMDLASFARVLAALRAGHKFEI